MRKLLIIFTLLFLFLLTFDIYPGLRGGSGWRWEYELPQSMLPVLLLAGLLLVYVLGVWWSRHKPVWVGLCWAVIMSAVLAVGVVSIRGNPAELLFIRTVSPVQTGASTIATTMMAEDGVQTTLDRWTDVMRESLDLNLIHFTTSPPGQPLIHYAIAKLLDSTPAQWSYALRPYQCNNVDVMNYTRGEILSVGVVGMFMPLWAALGVLPIFVASRNIYKDKQLALYVAQWWALVPTILLFMPVWNVIYPALCALSFMFLLSAILQNRIWLAIMSGAVLSFTTFLNFAVLPVLLLFGLFTLGCWWWVYRTRGFVWTLKIGAWFGIGLLTCWIPFWLATGYTPLDIFAVTLEKHTNLVQRAYLPWLILHPYDTWLFMGIPLAGVTLWAAFTVFFPTLTSKQVNRSSHQTNTKPLADVLTIAFVITFIAVNISGIAQGENGRIMSFYAPFILLVAARWLDSLPLMTTQALTVLVMASTLAVIPLDLNPPPDAPRTDIATLHTLEVIPADARFYSTHYLGEFKLSGYRLVADVGAQSITLETIWAGESRTERPYHLEVVAHVTDWQNEADSQTTSQAIRWLPQTGNYPPTCWQAGDVIHDVQVIHLPVVTAPVEWTLELRAVDPKTGDVAWVSTSDDEIRQAFIIPDIQYP
ncbi:MAG: hypothetical protein CUN56_09230 [Phototrophicales bacterium]|nr:MAG: hypothetical protein CUN56_09230 [Phototrophicales bacterium]